MIINNIKKHTVALYREKYGVPLPIGSGILISFQGKRYIVSAFHVFDTEEERIQIENDPEEKHIPQDDIESVMAKGTNMFFYIDYNVRAVVWTAHYDEINKIPIFNEDTEWCVCELSDKIVRFFLDAGKAFYEINEITSTEVKTGSKIIISGYPKYAQKEFQEEYRSYSSEMAKSKELSDNALFRVSFDNQHAYNYENKRYVKLPHYGIAGMSGGGLWCEKDNKYIPIGIILKQDPNENYVEGYLIEEILKELTQKPYEKFS